MYGHQVMTGHHFISYSRRESKDFVAKLRSALLLESPAIRVWVDTRDIRPGRDWDEQIHEAIQTYNSLLFIMTHDSVRSDECKHEWVRALKYKKPIIPLRLERDVTLPMRLGSRHYIDFTGAFDGAVAKLHKHLQWLASPEGELRTLKDRLEDAERDLEYSTEPDQQARIQKDIDELQQQIARQERVVEDPEQEETRVAESIERGIQRERQPEKPVSGRTHTKFINPPPLIAPNYFQDRHVETRLIGDYLKDDALRLMTVVGRAGIGKTAMVCRLLKSLESGRLPDEGGKLSVDGIVYLSELGSHRVSVPYLYADLCQLLPDDVAEELDRIYKDPQESIEAKMHALLDAFPEGRYVLLLDNFEGMINPATREIKNDELKGALRTILEHPHHAIKVIVTTRFAPEAEEFALVRPELQRTLNMNKGLPSPYAEEILRKMDADGTVGLKTAHEELLDEARERTRGFPRALEALFAILSADRNTTLREVLDNTKGLLPRNVVDVLVGQAFSSLDPVAQMVIQALAIYSYPVTPAAVDYLLLPHRTGGVDSAPVLGRLVNMKFVRREAGGAYYLHPVDREYALSRVSKGEATDRYETDASPFTQMALLDRAADYLAQTRTPRESWKTIEDLAPQLQEFELRYAAQDYDTAANVLLEIDFDYLYRWGHYELLTEMHERLEGKLSDPDLRKRSLGNLGSAYSGMGRNREAINYTKQALEIAREIGNRQSEGVWIGNLGNSYNSLGRYQEAISCYEQALEIAREIGRRRTEAFNLGNLGEIFSKQAEWSEAQQHLKLAIQIADEIEEHQVQREARMVLACGNLYAGDLLSARNAIDEARRYESEGYNYDLLALAGVIALRTGDSDVAKEALQAAVAQAEAQLSYSEQAYGALDAKGLALCGLALATGDKDFVPPAEDAYRKAREIAKAAGTVVDVLRLFDALQEADAADVLAEVRAVAEGTETNSI
jgi:tetratricopeptide (TPR) repeat protein